VKELFVSRAAEADLLEIWSYIFERNESAADRVIEEITAQFDLIAAHPHAGRRRPDVGTNYRSLPAGAYVVFYREMERRVEISPVLHGARDTEAIFRPGGEES